MSQNAVRTYHVLRACRDFLPCGWVICFSVVWPQEMSAKFKELHDTLKVVIRANVPHIIFSTKRMIVSTMRKQTFWPTDPFLTLELCCWSKSKSQLYPLGPREEMPPDTFQLQILCPQMGYFWILHTKDTVSTGSLKGSGSQIGIKVHCFQGEGYWQM